MRIVKRNGATQDFEKGKILKAVLGAVTEVAEKEKKSVDMVEVNKIVDEVVDYLVSTYKDSVGVEDVQNTIEKILCKYDHYKTLRAFITYRDRHSQAREFKKDVCDAIARIESEPSKENANVHRSPSAKKLQIAGEISKMFLDEKVLPPEFSKAHKNGDFHEHDKDFYMETVNCMQVPAGRMLKEGFDNGHGYIRPPKRIMSAATLIAIILQSSQNDMFGGQSIPSFDSALAPFVYENTTDNDIYQAMEALIFNLNTMHSRAGAQVPFSSLNVGLDTSENARRVTKQLLLAYEAGLGRGEAPIFPNIIFKVKSGVNRSKDDPNYDLFRLAMKVASKRMNPTFAFMDASFNKPYGNVEIMGCRTRVISNINGEETSEARGNLFFTTLNLPRIGIMANKNIDEFYRLLDERIDLCCRDLMFRYDYVKKLKVKDMPFVMGQGLYMGSENLDPEDSIENAIRNGTIAMGFIGLAETLVALTGKHHGESEESQKLGLEIVSHMKDKMDAMTKKTHLNFSLFATPAEGLSGRFVKLDKKQFGIIEGVTDKEYYTNSCHIPVWYKISHFKKIQLEGAYHKFCLGGAIAYVEFEAPPMNNLLAVEKELNHMADSDIGYAGINFPIDFCNDCGYQGVIAEDECPICGGKHIRRIRRITGYLSELNNFNDAKRAEARDRIGL